MFLLLLSLLLLLVDRLYQNFAENIYDASTNRFHKIAFQTIPVCSTSPAMMASARHIRMWKSTKKSTTRYKYGYLIKGKSSYLPLSCARIHTQWYTYIHVGALIRANEPWMVHVVTVAVTKMRTKCLFICILLILFNDFGRDFFDQKTYEDLFHRL